MVRNPIRGARLAPPTQRPPSDACTYSRAFLRRCPTRIWGADREVESFTDEAHRGHERWLIVAPYAAQLPDASIGAEGRVIVIQGKHADGSLRDMVTVPASRARELAQAILDATDEIDRWTGR
jgi:hypothetical protein